MTLIQTIIQKELNNEKQIKFTLIHNHFQGIIQYISTRDLLIYLFQKNPLCKHKIEIKIQQDMETFL